MIVAIVGPTGVGKTKLSVQLAKKYNAVIVNCDAVQVYRKLNIGSAKPTEEEKEGIKHLLFDIKDIDEEYTVCDYQKDLRSVLDEYQDKNIILVGGTGLYLCAGLMNYVFSERENKDLSMYSNEELYNMVKKQDDEADIHVNNRKRLENYLMSAHSSKEGNKLLYDVKFIGLTLPREDLYKRINKRVDKMFETGLLDEVKSLLSYKDKSRVLNTAIGYKEVLDYLDGKASLEDTKELIKKKSRHYAKRQYTWFNNKMNVSWFNVDLDNFTNTINQVENFLDVNEAVINDDKLPINEIDKFVTRCKAIVLDSENNITLGFSRNTYQFPGGHLEKGETLNACLERELKEELGLELNLAALNPFFKIREIVQNYRETEEKRENDIYYFVVRTDAKWDKEKQHLDNQERMLNYVVKQMPIAKAYNYIKKSVDFNPINELIAREMLLVLDECQKDGII